MKITRHAKARKQQRGFSKFILNMILENGRWEGARDGATKVYFGNKEYQRIIAELKRAIQALDKAKGGSVIIAGDKIITVYKG